MARRRRRWSLWLRAVWPSGLCSNTFSTRGSAAAAATGPATEEPLDDLTLVQKVESQLFRRAHVPKGQVSVNAEEGVVFLRGVMERHEDIERMGEEARRIDGVRAVENLVHPPGTPAPPSRSKLERQRAGE